MSITFCHARQGSVRYSPLKRLAFTAAALIATCLLCVPRTADAALIGLVASDPDAAITTGSIDYSYTDALCLDANGSGESGICGTTEGNGKNQKDYSDTETQADFFTLTIEDANTEGDGGGLMRYSDTDVGGTNDQNSFYGNYLLEATFSDTGIFQGGSVFLNYTADSGTSGAANGIDGLSPITTLLTGDLINFGFAGIGNSGTFEFEADNLTGHMATYGDLAGVIAGASLGTGNIPGGDWDSDSDFFTNTVGWSGSTTVDTFVPIPAALWLFMSGLGGLLLASRKKK